MFTLEPALKALDVGGWSTPRPSRFTPGKDPLYPLYRRLGGPRGLSGWVRKISPLLTFDPRTVQPVAGRYAGPHTTRCIIIIIRHHLYVGYLQLHTYNMPCFWGIQCCSCTVVTVYGTGNVSHVKRFVLLH